MESRERPSMWPPKVAVLAKLKLDAIVVHMESVASASFAF